MGDTHDRTAAVSRTNAPDRDDPPGRNDTADRDDPAERDSTVFQIPTTTSTRRRFLHGLAAAGTGPAALKRALEWIHDDVPDGRPVVWTRDRHGVPDRVRVVPKERYRRLSVYATLDVAHLRDRYDGVEGVTLAGGRAGALCLRVHVDRAGWAARRKLPERVRRMPVAVAEREGTVESTANAGRRDRSAVFRDPSAVHRDPSTVLRDPSTAHRDTTAEPHDETVGGRGGRESEKPLGCATVCDAHIKPFFDPVPASVQVKGRHDGRVTLDGTLGLVAWNDDPADPYECFVTAHHVVALDDDSAGRDSAEGDSAVGGGDSAPADHTGDGDSGGEPDAADYLFQSGLDDGEPRAETIGRYRAGSPLAQTGLDVAKYEVTANVDAAPLESAAEAQPDVTGSWTFAGLADATAEPGDSVPVSFAGRSTCWAESACRRTERDHFVQYEAVVAPALADAGDSGGPWVDPDGKLVCTMAMGPACKGVDDHHGPVAGALLSRLGVSLHPPVQR